MGTDFFFGMPLVEKERALRKSGDHCGYASSFTGRFSSKLPWKETLSFRYSAERHLSNAVESYFSNVMGEDYAAFGYYIWKLNKMESFFFFFFFILNVCFFFLMFVLCCFFQEGLPEVLRSNEQSVASCDGDSRDKPRGRTGIFQGIL